MLPARRIRFAAALAALALILTACSPTAASKPEPTKKPEVLATPDLARTILSGDTFSAAEGSVAVLVADDFIAGPPDPPYPDDKTLNCAYPTGTYGGKGGGGGLPTDMAHGDVVFNELYGLFAKDITPPSTPYSFADLGSYGVAKPVEVWSHAGRNILLVGVDAADFETRTIAERIHNVVQLLEKHHVQRFVLNMSFVIAPCDVQQWLEELGYTPGNGTVLAEAYRDDISKNPDIGTLKSTIDDLAQPSRDKEAWKTLWSGREYVQLRQRLSIGTLIRLLYGHLGPETFKQSSTPVTIEATLFQQLKDSSGLGGLLDSWKERPFIPVAAAGNGLDFDPALTSPSSSGGAANARGLRLDFPFAPAMWNTVVSVSSLPADEDDDNRAWYSNSGEAMLDGRLWLKLPADTQPWHVDGTSFAAPRLSYFETRYLLGGGTGACDNHVPALGYADSTSGPFTWNNVPYPSVTSYCGTFQNSAGF